ncbi:MAG: hypothetical protein NPIRA02_03470 [Nitrospirales bacterium]|nr:MAG: hypothetical protein NPIRA02_03470 [Nitrospirales bacterium]
MNPHPNTEADRLMLDAKKAILQEQHRRFQELQKEGRWSDAMQQLHVTLSCAADLLKDSVVLLERAVNQRQGLKPKPSPPDRPFPPDSPASS